MERRTAPSLTASTLSYIANTISQLINVAGSPITYLVRYEQGATAYGQPLVSYEINQMKGVLSGITDTDYELLAAGFKPPHDAKIWLKPPFAPRIGDRLQDPAGIRWEVRGVFPRVIDRSFLAPGATGDANIFYEVAIRRLVVPGYLSGFTPDQIYTGLIGYWPLDEGQGSRTYDYSGYKNHGTLVNGPAWTKGVLGSSLQFSASSTQYVNIPSSPNWYNLNSFSYTFWFYPTDISSAQAVLGTYNNANNWMFYRTAGDPAGQFSAIAYYLRNDTATVGYLLLTAPFSPNQWHHVAVSLQAGGNTASMLLYADGQLVASQTVSNFTSWYLDTTQPLQISKAPGWYSFNGIIDDVRIYNRVLSANEIATIHLADMALLPDPALLMPQKLLSAITRTINTLQTLGRTLPVLTSVASTIFAPAITAPAITATIQRKIITTLALKRSIQIQSSIATLSILQRTVPLTSSITTTLSLGRLIQIQSRTAVSLSLRRIAPITSRVQTLFRLNFPAPVQTKVFPTLRLGVKLPIVSSVAASLVAPLAPTLAISIQSKVATLLALRHTAPIQSKITTTLALASKIQIQSNIRPSIAVGRVAPVISSISALRILYRTATITSKIQPTLAISLTRPVQSKITTTLTLGRTASMQSSIRMLLATGRIASVQSQVSASISAVLQKIIAVAIQSSVSTALGLRRTASVASLLTTSLMLKLITSIQGRVLITLKLAVPILLISRISTQLMVRQVSTLSRGISISLALNRTINIQSSIRTTLTLGKTTIIQSSVIRILVRVPKAIPISSAVNATVRPPLGLDGTASGAINLGTSGSVSLTTNNSNDVIIVAVATVSTGTTLGTPPTVSGVSGAGLTWTRRKQFVGNNVNIEEWYAISSNPLSAASITVTLAATGTAVIIAFGISGANTTSPFDPNTSLPATATGTASPLTVSINTSNARDFIFGLGAAGEPGVAGSVILSVGTGFTQIANAASAAGKVGGKQQNNVNDAAEYRIVSTTVTNYAVAFTESTNRPWVLIADAVQAA